MVFAECRYAECRYSQYHYTVLLCWTSIF